MLCFDVFRAAVFQFCVWRERSGVKMQAGTGGGKDCRRSIGAFVERLFPKKFVSSVENTEYYQ